MAGVQISDIGASLQFGPFWSKKHEKVWWTFVIFSVVAYLVFILSCIIDWEDTGIIVFLGATLGCGVMFGSMLYLILRNRKLKKRIKLWMQDAVLLKAQSNTVDRFRSYRQIVEEVSIRVHFRYLDKRHEQISGTKTRKRYTFFNQYTDRDLLISYSPTYDQIMLIRPKSEQRILAEWAKSSKESA